MGDKELAYIRYCVFTVSKILRAWCKWLKQCVKTGDEVGHTLDTEADGLVQQCYNILTLFLIRKETTNCIAVNTRSTRRLK